MKLTHLLIALPIALLASCNLTTPQNVDTVKLEDAVVAAAKSARKAGAKTMVYEASIVTTAGGTASVVVPVGIISPQFGSSLQRAVGSKVTITVEVQPTASKPISGDRFRLNTQTLEAVPLQ